MLAFVCCPVAGPVCVRAFLFRQRGRARRVPQVHPEDQEKGHHPHQRDGHHAAGSVAGQGRCCLNGDGGGGTRR